MAKKSSKNFSLSEKLSSLIQTQPKLFDSDDDDDFTTADKIVTKENESDYSADELDAARFRKLNTKYLEEEDNKYLGKGISRKDLVYSNTNSSQIENDDIISHSKTDVKINVLEKRNEEEDSSDKELSSENEDIHNEYNKTSLKTLQIELKSIGKRTSDIDVNKELFLQATKDVEKGKALKSQLLLLDFFLDCRMKFQSCLAASNQLPNYKNFCKFKGHTQFDELNAQTKKSLRNLLTSLLSLQETLLSSNEEFLSTIKNQSNPHISEMNNDSEINSDSENEIDFNCKGLTNFKIFNSKIKKLSEFSKEIEKRHKLFQSYRNRTIQKWDDKTRLGYISSKNFGAFEQSALKQIEQILMDRDRLISRTQTKRSNYTILGSDTNDEPPNKQIRFDGEDSNANNLQKSKTTFKEIFDDDDFYHQLLNELIKRKASDVTDPVLLGRQWMQLQKIRNKMKKTVDTKASKARKVRFVVHPKLVNFMMPTSISMGYENARIELINSLFGKKK